MSKPLGVRGVILCATALLACKALEKGQLEPSKEGQPAAPTAAAADGSIAFQKTVAKAGTKAHVKRSTSSKFTMQGKVFREASSLEIDFEVKSSDEFRITKGSIDVKELFTTSQQGTGSEKKTVSPLAGSRYVVSRSDSGKLSALDSVGGAVPASQLTLLTDEFKGAFEKDETGAFIPSRALKVSEKLTPPADSILKLLEIKDDGKTTMDGIEFILKSGDSDRATFDVSMTMTQNAGSGMRVRAKLVGSIAIRPAGTWLLRVDLKGPLEVLDSAGKQLGTGDFTIAVDQTFGSA